MLSLSLSLCGLPGTARALIVSLRPPTGLQKILAKAGEEGYHKMAVTTRALVEITRTKLKGNLQPPELHFHRYGASATDMVPVKVQARVKPLVENFDALDYVARAMFAARSQPWPKAIGCVFRGLSLSLLWGLALTWTRCLVVTQDGRAWRAEPRQDAGGDGRDARADGDRDGPHDGPLGADRRRVRELGVPAAGAPSSFPRSARRLYGGR